MRTRVVLFWNYCYLLLGCLLQNPLHNRLASVVKTAFVTQSNQGWVLCRDLFCSTDQSMQVRRFRGGFTAAQQDWSVVDCPGCKPATWAPFISVEILKALRCAVPGWRGNRSFGSGRVKCCSTKSPHFCAMFYCLVATYLPEKLMHLSWFPVLKVSVPSC